MIENLPNEIWLPVPNYEGIYMVSNIARVKVLERIWFCGANHRSVRKNPEMLLSIVDISDGYKGVSLVKDGVKRMNPLHRVVAKAFVPNPNNYNIVNHEDGNKLNNCDWNLKWGTTQYNTAHAVENRLHCFGEKHGMHKLTEDDVRQIRKEFVGGRQTKILAARYGVWPEVIRSVAKYRAWKLIA